MAAPAFWKAGLSAAPAGSAASAASAPKVVMAPALGAPAGGSRVQVYRCGMASNDGGVPTLRSSAVAAAAGVNLQTLRYYERRGLLAEPDRSLGGHRMYPAETVTVLKMIKAAQRLGFTLDEVAGLLDAGRHRHGRGADAGLRTRARTKLAEVEAKIADLQVIAGTLRAAVDAGCDDLIACAARPGCPIPFATIAAGAPATDPS